MIGLSKVILLIRLDKNMLNVKGKYNEALIFADSLEKTAESQLKTLCDQPFVKGSHIRIMPDVHAGAGCTIGTTMTISDKVVPNLVGVDIGCGMEVVQISNRKLEPQKLDKLVYQRIPGGFSIRAVPHPFHEEISLESLRCAKAANLNLSRALLSIGTLGGGNHFIEANCDSNGNLYLVVHSGSRHLGYQVAEYYQEQGFLQLLLQSNPEIAVKIRRLEEEGSRKELKKAWKDLRSNTHLEIPKSLAYVEGELFQDYLHDMKLVQQFASLNRRAIMRELIQGMKLDVVEAFTTIHNYIDTENMILRKGAVSARKGEKLLIPINMRDGSMICIGKGNPDWNESAPHGAGRLMSRAEARNSFTVSAYQKQMEGIYTTSVNRETLDECPMAYKSMKDILDNIQDTVEVQEVLKPVYNFKAADESLHSSATKNKVKAVTRKGVQR